MAWYSKAFGGRVESHKAKIWAVSRCNFAAAGGEDVTSLGVYKKDPTKHPDAENMLPGMIEEAQRKAMAKQIRAAMKKGKR